MQIADLWAQKSSLKRGEFRFVQEAANLLGLHGAKVVWLRSDGLREFRYSGEQLKAIKEAFVMSRVGKISLEGVDL